MGANRDDASRHCERIAAVFISYRIWDREDRHARQGRARDDGSRHCERSAAVFLFVVSRTRMDKHYWVYIMTNANNTVLYTGVTNDLARRVHQHRTGEGSAFARRYNVTKLVFCERFDRPFDAIGAEKRIKAGSRAKKGALIEAMNPAWKDLLQAPDESRT